MQFTSNSSIFISERIIIRLSDVSFIETINEPDSGYKLSSLIVCISGIRLTLSPEEGQKLIKQYKEYHGIKEEKGEK